MAVCGISAGSLIVGLTSMKLLVDCKKNFLFGWLCWERWCRGNYTLAGTISSWFEMKSGGVGMDEILRSLYMDHLRQEHWRLSND